MQIRWFSGENYTSSLIIKDNTGTIVFSGQIPGMEVSELYYTQAEKNQSIPGLVAQSWIGPEKYFKYEKSVSLQAGKNYQYAVTLNGQTFSSEFKTAPSTSDWESIRFIALSDSETEPRGRVTNRAWYPGVPLIRLFPVPSAWKNAFGTTTEEGFELPNYMLTEQKGFAENLKILKSRNPDFVLMPGDLVQGGAYMPGWDEFWRHTSGEFDQVFDKFPVIPALGNWEAFGGVSGGYGFNERGTFNPVLGRSRFHRFFEFSTDDPDQKHRQSYYRTDYGPITILTLDSSNGTPDQKRSDFSDSQKVKNQELNEIGTDTQENYTQAEYNSAGGTDLSGFGPGSPQYEWLEKNLELAKNEGRLIFVQFHHIPYSSGEGGVPINHELATGQEGIPVRILNPLFEKYGVIAVFAGHDELFERSFVDEDGDGKGVHYYDVGVAGDGMRGVKRNWLSAPLQTLNYNSFSKWTADQKSAEVWDNSSTNPVLLDGGKHYGHLEVNVKKVQDGAKTFAQIDFEPVYAFPVMNSQYQLQRMERRVYNDPVRILVELKTSEPTIAPQFKTSIQVELNSEGRYETKPSDYLVNSIQQDWIFSFSRSPLFTCVDLGVKEISVTVKNSQAQEWTGKVTVEVLDKIAPDFEATDAFLAFDKVIGKVTLTPESFYIREEFITENCLNSGGVSIDFDRKELTCSDLTGQPIPILITVTDRSGNSTSKIRSVNLNPIESKKISITPSGTHQGKVGDILEIKLGEEFSYAVDAWLRNGQVIEGQKGKTIQVTQTGTYYARVIPLGGCVVESQRLEVSFVDNPYGPLRSLVDLNLNSSGKATLTPSSLFVTWPLSDPTLTLTLSQSEYTCQDIGEKEVTVTIKNQTGQTWTEKTRVKIQDKEAPVLVTKTPSLNFDKAIGVLELNAEDFVDSASDNCGVKSISLSKTRITCSDLGQPIELLVSVSDLSGNSTSKSVQINPNVLESKKISITPSGTHQGKVGDILEIKLGEEFSYTVDAWLRNGQVIEGQKGKTIQVNQSGTYFARVISTGGCLVETQKVDVSFEDRPYGPLKSLLELNLNSSGKATLTPSSLFVTWPLSDPTLTLTLSQSEFTCQDIGEKEVTVTIKNQTGQTWTEKTRVKVQDKEAPILVSKDFILDYDVQKGSVELKPENFLSSLTDNCTVSEVRISKTSASCEDLGKEITVAIRAVDGSGNVSEATAKLTVRRLENQQVSITGSTQFCQGEKGTLVLNSSASFEVIRWRRNGLEIPGQTVKTLEVAESGKYHAVIRYAGACLSETAEWEVKVNPLPSGEISVDGNILRAPEGNFTYQWYRNGEIIPGANSRALTVDLMGDYSVELTSASGCIVRLKPVTLTISGLVGNWVKNPMELKLFPNPTSSKVQLQLPDDTVIDISTIQIYSMEGKKVTELVSIVKVSDSQVELTVSSLPSATYLVWIIAESQNSYQGKFVVVK
ncbi:T9SS type A sorting domain-containing protein [Algoriphagus sp. AK58]|uniref:T9SS type A sorting domain-containing protein n=1 Tax=Algoriphagus sp. AK58 TaxID=1406877 RepID=UPI00164F59BA